MYSIVLLPERDCTKCTAQQKLVWGCTTDAKQPVILDDVEYKRCPRRPLLEKPHEYSELFWLYENYSNGILPEEGALLSQPHKLLQFFHVIRAAKSVAEAEQQEREQKKLKRPGLR